MQIDETDQEFQNKMYLTEYIFNGVTEFSVFFLTKLNN